MTVRRRTDEDAKPRRRLRYAPLVLVVLYLVLVSAFFVAFPSIDTTVAGWFHSDTGFPASRVEPLIRLRKLGDQIVILIVVALVASLVGKILWPARPIAVRPRSTVFLLSSLALGPGLVVNGLFKSYSGRPRPVQVDLFGGDAPFVPAWHFTHYCASNCSFVAGEASSAAWLFAVVLLAPRDLRLYLAAAAAGLCLALSVNRMAFGGHFLSDVMIAWGITLLIVLALYRLLVEGPLGARIDDAVNGALERAGRRLRGQAPPAA